MGGGKGTGFMRSGRGSVFKVDDWGFTSSGCNGVLEP